MPLTRRQTSTKIVATVGPACADAKTLRELALAGVDVFRLNFSHGSHETHARTIRLVRQIERQIDRPLATLGDLCGPKLRIGDIAGGSAKIARGDEVTLTNASADGAGLRFQVSFAGLSRVARTGEAILLDDGRFRLTVRDVRGEDVRCVCHDAGTLLPRKGVNLPETAVAIPALTAKDRRDLAFAVGEGIDMLALSFVREAKDLAAARRAMARAGRTVPLLAKIEKPEAVANLDAILAEADGAMVARGDLGIEVPLERVPTIQKRVIAACNRRAKPVITATQMLESMIENPRPTRAEVTDIYNAILDGTDAVMLSAETAVGKHPVAAVAMMESVCREAEQDMRKFRDLAWLLESGDGAAPSVSQAVSAAATQIARQLGLDAIIVATQTGQSARRVARFRPGCPVFAFSPDPDAVAALCLSWGVESRVVRISERLKRGRYANSAVIAATVKAAKDFGLVRKGARVAVLAGFPLGVAGSTNTLRVIEVE